MPVTATVTLTALAPLLLVTAPEEEDVVAGWTAFGLFGLGIVAIALLGFSLVKRLKNVERAADAGLYDPSDPRRTRPPRGLAAARQLREQADPEQADPEQAGGEQARGEQAGGEQVKDRPTE